MRRSSGLFNLLGAVGLAGLLSGCGSGDSGTTPVATPTAPIVSSGTITAFGSVYINDKKYEIDDSTSTSVDGSASVKGDVEAKKILKLGMVVKVSGTASGSSRMASTITHTDTLEGPIQAKDLVKGTLTILGQTVVVDDTTKFDVTIPPTTFASLVVNDVVEVSGFVKSDGTIAASFIERKAGAPTDCSLGCEIKGFVTNHDTIAGATTFQIGGLTVNYAAPADISHMPTPIGSNWNNLFVEVKGTGLAGTTLTATKVEPEGFQASEGNEVELEGFVTSVSGAGQFTLGTTQVQAANAVYLGGTIDEVAVGQKLEVEGTISNNVITASKVKFKAAVRIESNVASKTANTLTLEGLPGITISVNSQTEFKNVANLAGISVGSNVRIRGREEASNTVIATEVEFRNANPDSKVTLQGVAQSPLNPPSITILGNTIDTSGLQLQGTDDVLINSFTFFSEVKPNTTIVKAKGTLPGPVWKEVELESD